MTHDKVRQDFEAFHVKQFGWDITRPEHYEDVRVKERYLVWKAGRAAERAEIREKLGSEATLKGVAYALALEAGAVGTYILQDGETGAETERCESDFSLDDAKAAITKILEVI